MRKNTAQVISPTKGWGFVDSNGDALAMVRFISTKLETSTPLDTYTDKAAGTA